jgi:GNAT superfamily N-acetyltransferase
MHASPDKRLRAAVRGYGRAGDFDAVGDFLVRTYSTGGPHQNWIQPRWEYMHFHPYLDEASLARIGIWEAGGELVAVVHHEHRLGEVYVEVAPGWVSLKPEMLDYASGHLAGTDDDGPYVAACIDDRDRDFCEAAAGQGFGRTDKRAEATSVLTLDAPLPRGRVPAGFRVSDVEHDEDLAKLHRLLHRGFNHPGEPDPAELPGRRKMQSAPNYRGDLNVVVVAPNGDFVSLCGTWFEPVNRVAMVEPVCTDPDFRALGLGKAAVLEALRRCQELGATVAYVGSTLPIYRSVGFKTVYTQHRWVKRL